jgi:hypothetical protein
MIDALSYASLAELPEVWNGKREWKDAIVLIDKYDGTDYFAIAKRSEDGEVRIVKDFGSMFAIKGIKRYYPYEFYIRQEDFDEEPKSKKEENDGVEKMEIEPVVESIETIAKDSKEEPKQEEVKKETKSKKSK